MFIKGYKNVLMFLVAMMLLVGLTACGSDKATTSEPTQAAPIAEAAEPAKVEPEIIIEECDEEEVLREKAVSFFNSLPDNSYMKSAEKFKEQFELARNTVLVLDIRRADDFANGHLEGSINIPMKEVGARIAEIPTNEEIAIVCYSGQTASQTAAVLRMAGYNTVIITGGFRAIEAEEFEIVN